MKKLISNKEGFTLIELLVVIVIIGILAGITIAIINPAEQNKRARESVLRNSVGQICNAMSACIAGQEVYNAANCNSLTKIGATQPQEPPSVTWETLTSFYTNNPTLQTGYVQYLAKDSGGCYVGCRIMNNFSLVSASSWTATNASLGGPTAMGGGNSGATLLSSAGCSINP